MGPFRPHRTRACAIEWLLWLRGIAVQSEVHGDNVGEDAAHELAIRIFSIAA